MRHHEPPTSGRPTSAERSIPRYLQEFLKSYLYRLHGGKISDPLLEVVALSGIQEPYTRRRKQLSLSDELEGRFLRILDPMVSALIRFQGALYHTDVFFESGRPDLVEYFVFAVGDGDETSRAGQLLDHLLKQAVQTSPYRNAMLLATSERLHGSAVGLYPLAPGKDRLEDVFLPETILGEIRLFIRALEQYDRLRTPLRYLFSGKPGTGKTKIIRAVAAACADKATFLFANGSEENVDELFEIAGMFCPVVLCIDDIDMMTGSRQEGLFTSRLATFLQKLDGFARAGEFLLASTNDRTLVDLAASRPGRFDRVIDVEVVRPADFIRLVESKTGNDAVRALFDQDVLAVLRRKGVTGAFIANLTKHLELVAELQPECLTQEYVLGAVDRWLKGFGSEKRVANDDIGFRAA
ncbi:MAG: ATP-binding protein [Bacteroidota bacterium]